MKGERDRERLLREAEREMRRTLTDERRPSKRQRQSEDGEEVCYVDCGRFDYAAVAELAKSGAVAGFLITCDFRREKSATKEANKLLTSYLVRHLPASGAVEGAADAPSKPLLSIVKMGSRGVVMLKLSGAVMQQADDRPTSEQPPAGSAQEVPGPMQLVQQVASELLADVDSGRVARLQYCQRIMPIHTTCQLDAAALGQAAARLAVLPAAAAASWAGDKPPSPAAEGHAGSTAAVYQLSFGVAYKPRGGEQGAKTIPEVPAAAGPPTGQTGAQGGQPAAAAPGDKEAGSLGRMEVIRSVAGGFERALKEQHGMRARVDLKAPEWALLVEVMPVMGSAYAALSLLPQGMCIAKPKLQMRPVGQGK